MNEQDKSLSVNFFMHPVENPRKTKEAGRPIFDSVEMVSIMAPGNTKTEYTAKASSMHYDSNARKQWTYAERFAEQYASFKRGSESQHPGTPLSEVPFLSLAQKAEMNASKIYTVEQLAGMADRDIGKKGMGFRSYVDSAKAYLDTTQGTNALLSELEELRRQVASVKASAPADISADVEDSDIEFDGMEDDDLRNILTDAGTAVDGRWSRKRLVEEIRKLEKEAA